ncbi:DUF5753 domain-containing protein [Amycolatopsis sp. NPDC058986]|uniref:DUF5753 domain-containing protein n=1 Tax=unclassified Amycolatopsis TaxID=2618356 RepID=UPI00366BEB20
MTSVPRLLQTEDYAAAFFAKSGTRERNRNLNVRVHRTKRLREEDPLVLYVLIDETALTRKIAKSSVVVAQLLHIIEISELDNVTVQVIPDAAGAHEGLRGAFSILTFPPDTIDDLGYVDHAGGNLQLVKAPQVAELARRFANLSKIALGEQESRELLLKLADHVST